MMMVNRKFQRILLVVSILLAILIVAFFSSLPLLVRSQYLESLVRRAIQQQMGYLPNFERLRLSVFPVPVLHIENLELTPSKANSEMPLIKADRALFRPALLPLLLGKPELAHAAIKHADIHYTWRGAEGALVKTFSVQDVTLDLWNLRPNHPIRFKAKGKFLSDSENVLIDGVFSTDFAHFRTRDLTSKVQVSINPLELSRLSAWWGSALPIQIDQGTISLSVQVVKDKDSSSVDFDGALAVNGLIYERPGKSGVSASADYRLKFKFDLDLDTGLFTLSNAALETPFSGSPFGIDAKFNVFQWNIDEILVKSKSLRLEILPQYVLPFQEALPVNLGFSGESQLDFFMKGTPELFLINSQIDLTQTTLAYSKYFSKPIGVPLSLRGDLKLAGGRVLRGDFSLEFEQASFKGSLVALDLASGEGEMTILTNKFNVDQWQNYFPPLREVDLTGAAKVLINAKGNFNRPERLRVMHNITLDQLQIKAKNGAEIRNLSGSIDLGPVDSELKDFQVTLGGSQFLAQGKMFRQPEARWLIEVASPFINLQKVVSELRRLTEVVQMEGMNFDLAALDESIKRFFPQDEILDSFEAQLAFDQGRVIVPAVRFGAFGGNVLARATYDSKSPASSTVVELELDRLNLARLQPSSGKQLFHGNLFAFATLNAEGPYDSTWASRLKGQGSFAVTNGEFQTVDLLGSLGQVAELAALGRFKSGTTRFNDIRGTFAVANQKVQTDDLIFLSDDFQIDGRGEVGFDGNLNFRLSVFVLPSMSRKISSRLGENSKLGPIPVLIAGPIASPSVKPDPMLMQTFLESLIREQFSKITSRFFPSAPQESNPSSLKGTVQSEKGAKGQPQSLEQALLESGLGLLDQFLSKKNSSS